MAVQKQKSALFAKYGSKLDAAVKGHAADPIEYGNMRVPPGITAGIAKLVECKFDTVAPGKTNAGEWYFRAAGVIVEPKSVMVNGQEVTCEGLQTSIMEMVCQTTTQAGKVTTVDEHVANILNEMKKLGGAQFVEGAGGAELESLAAALKEAGPYFKFSTSQGKATKEFPEPRIWENWYGSKGLENYTPPEDSGVEDNSAAADDSEQADDTQVFDETAGDLDSQAELADGDDEETAVPAREAITAAAVAAGWTEAQVEGYPSNWTDLVAALKGGEGPPEAEEEAAEPEDEGIKEGDVYKYQPIDPKTKKGMINPKTKKAVKVECEVKKVDKKKETVDLLNLDDKKTKYANVPWDKLEGD